MKIQIVNFQKNPSSLEMNLKGIPVDTSNITTHLLASYSFDNTFKLV